MGCLNGNNGPPSQEAGVSFHTIHHNWSRVLISAAAIQSSPPCSAILLDDGHLVP